MMPAALVASGIFLSRILGLVRESLKARYLGASGSIAADAFHAAFRIPNTLQNLLGEGALSASLIPVYSNALAKGNREEADRIAGAVGALLGLLAAALVLLGILAAPALVNVIAPGFGGAKRDLTILLTRILFPGAALFVFSAWCLGILNSHRRFFLSYTAPVAWNLAMIAALVMYRGAAPTLLATRIAWASVIGAGLTFLVQLPVVLGVATQLRLSLGRGNEGVRQVVRNFVPAFLSRGVVQINAFIDQAIASLLPQGAVSLLFYTQTLTILPISLFGMSVAAAELPTMSSSVGSADETGAHVRGRLESGLRQIAFFVVPSAVAFMLLGDVIAAALYQHGRFTPAETRFTWGILSAASIGLLASAMGRLYSSAFFALHDTRTPLRISLVRVALATLIGFPLALYGPQALGIAPQWGAAALALSSSVAGWVEFTLLRSRVNARIGRTGAPLKYVMTLVTVAIAAGGAGFAIKVVSAGLHRVLIAVFVLGAFGGLYFGLTRLLRIPESAAVLDRIWRTRRGV
ncbi:MAG: murein biosynthesis integral membrane protein MurJ [Gemmatimonadaceae bacterium]